MSNAAPKLHSMDGGAKSARELMASPDFKALVKKRWTVSFSLLTALFVSYYGYILVLGTNKEWVSQKVSDGPDAVTTVAIPLGIAVILVAWVLTALYVVWANKSYDPEVQRLKGQLKQH
jgi:uncharacterized membrane protein (DUF485 family)